jgi:hypothetical protein
MNRRNFLLSSAAVGASIGARSYAQIQGANDRVNVGIIGLGRRGSIVSAALLADPRVRIIAVSDI